MRKQRWRRLGRCRQRSKWDLRVRVLCASVASGGSVLRPNSGSLGFRGPSGLLRPPVFVTESQRDRKSGAARTTYQRKSEGTQRGHHMQHHWCFFFFFFSARFKVFGRDVVSGETTGKSAMCFSAGHAANEKQGRQQCCENCIKKEN